MKRAIAFFLILCLFIPFLIIPTSAEGEIFVAIGNNVLPLTDAMPIKSNGMWYVDYQCLTQGTLGLSASYNAAEEKLVLYNWDTTLIFDLKTSTAHIVHEDIHYKAATVAASGTVYIPVQFTCQLFGLECSYNAALPMLRIKHSTDIPNNMFHYIAKNAIPGLLEDYRQKKASADNPKLPEHEVSEPKTQFIRLSFDITDGKNIDKILNSISKYGLRATFFISANAIPESGNAIRRAIIQGHSVGILAAGTADLPAANQKLFDVAKIKTRLVRFKNGSSSLSPESVEQVIAQGYRLWDSDIALSGNASQMYSQTVSRLKSSARSPVITVPDSAAGLNSLSRILRHLDSGNYGSYAISLLDTPVNSISERR